jgi:hypothetical protein
MRQSTCTVPPSSLVRWLQWCPSSCLRNELLTYNEHASWTPVAEGIMALHDPKLRAHYDLKVGATSF